MEKIRHLSAVVTKRIKQKLPFLRKPFREIIASNLLTIFSFTFVILGIAFFLEILIVSSIESEAELISVTSNVSTFFLIFAIASIVFNYVYIRPRIIDNVERYRAFIKFNVLRTYKAAIKTMLVSLAILATFAFISPLAPVFKSIFISDLLVSKIINIWTQLSVVPIVFAFPYLLNSMSAEKQIKLRFEAIQDFEKIADEEKIMPLARIWNFLLSDIVYALESTIKNNLDFSGEVDPSFYVPFNTLSIAAIIGNDDQRKKIKEWVSNTETIYNLPKTKDTTKAKLIIEHVEKIEKDKEYSEFCNFQKTCCKYGFQYHYEHGFRTLSKRIGKTGRILLDIAGIGGFVVAIISLIK